MKSLIFSFLSLFVFLSPMNHCLANDIEADCHEIEVGDYVIPIPNHYQVQQTDTNNFTCIDTGNEKGEFSIAIDIGNGPFNINDYAEVYRNLMYKNGRLLKEIHRYLEPLKDSNQNIHIAIQLWFPSGEAINSIVMIVLESSDSHHGVSFLSRVPMEKAEQWHHFMIDNICTHIRKK